MSPWKVFCPHAGDMSLCMVFSTPPTGDHSLCNVPFTTGIKLLSKLPSIHTLENRSSLPLHRIYVPNSISPCPQKGNQVLSVSTEMCPYFRYSCSHTRCVPMFGGPPLCPPTEDMSLCQDPKVWSSLSLHKRYVSIEGPLSHHTGDISLWLITSDPNKQEICPMSGPLFSPSQQVWDMSYQVPTAFTDRRYVSMLGPHIGGMSICKVPLLAHKGEMSLC